MNSHPSIFVMLSLLSSLFGCSGNKGKSDKSQIFPPEKYSVIQAKYKGKVVIGSMNQAYDNYKLKVDYPWCLIISIGLNLDRLDKNGLPSGEESNIAYREEDEFVTQIKKITISHYIGHLFNDGFLDVYVYLNEPKAVNTYLQTQLNKPELKRGIGYRINKDPDWETVAPFMK